MPMDFGRASFLRFVILIAASVCASLPAIVSAQSRLSDDVLPSNRQLARFGLERAWWSQATINPNRSRVQYITIDDENVYIQTTGGIVTAFDNESGKKLWAVQLGRRDDPSFAATSNEDYLLIISGLTLYSLDKFRGEVVWHLRLPKQPSTSPTVDANQVYFGTLDGSLFAYSLRSIDDLYQQSLLPEFSQSALEWRYTTGKEIPSPAVSTGRVVNFASRDGSLYSVTTKERHLTWQFETDAPLSAPLAQTPNSIVMASEDFNVYCVNIDNGTLRWKPFVLGYAIREQPRVIGSRVYLIADGGGLFCLSHETGVELWQRSHVVGFLGATQDNLFVSDELGNLVVLSRSDGAVSGAFPLRRFSVRLANDRTDRLYLVTKSGLVVCLRKRGKDFPTFHMFPERLPLVPEIAPEEEEKAEAESPFEPAAPTAVDDGT